MTVQLSMFDLMTLPDSSECISLPESAVGIMPSISPAGRARSGLAPAPASRSPSPESKRVSQTTATSGPSGESLSASDALQRSLESRLRARLNGSDLCEVIWKPWNTPWGQCLSKPRARVRTISETDIGLWQTMVADDSLDRAGGKVNSRGEPKLSAQAISSWPTPTTRDHKDGGYCPNVPVNGLLGRMVWPTPTSLAPARNGQNEAGNSAGLVAIRKHAMAASWPTPQARDHFPAHTPEYVASKKALGHGMANLNDVVAHSNGSSAPTEKPGALNPEFVCWLMGYPTEWVSCGVSVTRSTRAPRRPSSEQR
jgi:hypothetical protein